MSQDFPLHLLILRRLSLADAEELFLLTDANRLHLRKWLPWLDNVTAFDHSREFIAKVDQAFIDNGTFVCGIWQGGALCGVIGHNQIDWSGKVTEPGYWLSRSAVGRGIMTAACGALVGHAFHTLGLEKIVITAATENGRSQSIPDRLGFTRARVIADAEWLYDHHVDHTENVLFRKDWRPELQGDFRIICDLPTLAECRPSAAKL